MRKGSKVKLATLALAGLGVVMSSSAAIAEGMKTSSTGGMKVWSDENDSYWFSVGGLLQLDQVFSHSSHHAQSNADFANSAHVRRARFITQGGVGCHWEYYFGVDFGTVNEPQWANMYLQYDGFENSHIQVGVISQPLSLSNWESVGAITTMERPMIANAFIPNYGLGIYADYAMDMLTFAASVSAPYPANKANNYPSANPGSDDQNITGRVTFSPVHAPDYVWHFGVSGLYQALHKHNNPADYGFAIPLEMVGRNWPGYATNQLTAQGAGLGNAKSWSTAGVELGALWGPFSLQAEYMGATAESANTSIVPTNHYKGWYGLVAYNLTGESKSYDFPTGTFGKVTPAASTGAWELFAQYSYLSLRDHNTGPVANVATAGLNWYATEAVKITAEYERANYGHLNTPVFLNGNALPAKRKDVNMYGVRFQADFSA